MASWLRRIALVSAFTLAVSSVAMAEPHYRADAEQAWAKGDFAAAEKAYKVLIQAGHLETGVVVQAYVRLGSARAALGKKDEAVKSFRAAAVLDPNFQPLPEGGPKAIEAAQIARSSVAKLGPLVFEAKVPEKLEVGAPFKVNASVDTAHLPMVIRMSVTLRYKDKENAPPIKTVETFPEPTGAASVTIDDLPKDMTGEVEVQVAALDSFYNKIATQSVTRTASSMNGSQKEEGGGGSIYGERKAPPQAKEKADSGKGSGGILSTAWPFVIGGIVLAAGGASMYYVFLGRPSNSVLLPATVRTQ